MHPQQVVAECTSADEVSFCIGGGAGSRVGWTLSSISKNAPLTWVLGGGGQRRAKKLSQPLQIITRRLNDPHSVISINNAQHIVVKT